MSDKQSPAAAPSPPPPKKLKGGIMSWILWTRKFSFGTVGALTATTVIQPIDTVKVRIQINSEQRALGKKVSIKPTKVAKMILKLDGPLGFYMGMQSAWLRQVVYGTARLGLYFEFMDMVRERKGRQPNFLEKCACSLTSGALGSFIGNPTDLCLVRFQSDSLLPKKERRNYKNVFDALIRIIKEEGVGTLWRGAVPTMARSGSMNLGMMATHDEVKDQLCKFWQVELKDAPILKVSFPAKLAAGFMASACCLPFDNAKTKLQKMKINPKTGKLPYKNIFDCMLRTFTREGPLKLWVGFPTFYARVGTHAFTTLFVMDTVHSYANRHWKGVYYH